MTARDIARAVEDQFDENYRTPTGLNAFSNYTPTNETMRCPTCQVSWNGDTPCWVCGEEHKPAGHVTIDTGMVVHWAWGLPEAFDTTDTLFD